MVAEQQQQQQRDEPLVCKDIPVHGKYLIELNLIELQLDCMLSKENMFDEFNEAGKPKTSLTNYSVEFNDFTEPESVYIKDRIWEY